LKGKGEDDIIPARDLTEPLSEKEAKKEWPVLMAYANGAIKTLHRRITERLSSSNWLDVTDEEWATAVLLYQIRQEHTTLGKHYTGCWHRADCEACKAWIKVRDHKPEEVILLISDNTALDRADIDSRLYRAEKLIWTVIILRRIMFEIAGAIKVEYD
jgi:hypothetical protein